MRGCLAKRPFLRFCSIAGYSPEWFFDDEKNFKYSNLVPRKEWWQVWHSKFHDNLQSDESKAWYEEKYRETVLSKLDPEKVKRELLELSEHYDVCLLCYETPEKFCHRHIVQKWFNENGVECCELDTKAK